MSKEHKGRFYISPKTKENCKTLCRGTDGKPPQKFCNRTFEISLKCISECFLQSFACSLLKYFNFVLDIKPSTPPPPKELIYCRFALFSVTNFLSNFGGGVPLVPLATLLEACQKKSKGQTCEYGMNIFNCFLFSFFFERYILPALAEGMGLCLLAAEQQLRGRISNHGPLAGRLCCCCCCCKALLFTRSFVMDSHRR